MVDCLRWVVGLVRIIDRFCLLYDIFLECSLEFRFLWWSFILLHFEVLLEIVDAEWVVLFLDTYYPYRQ